jgi:hypothetical protein
MWEMLFEYRPGYRRSWLRCLWFSSAPPYKCWSTISVISRSLRTFSCCRRKSHSSMRNLLFGLPGQILCEKSPYVNENDEHTFEFDLQMSHLLRPGWVWAFRVRLMLSSPNACLIIASVSVPHFPRFAHNLMLFFCRIHREIASSQIHDSK